MTEKYVNQPIKYARFRKISTEKIVNERGKWECKRKTITRGYDALLGKWDVVNTEYTFLPMADIGCHKSLVQTIFLKRTAFGADLKEISKIFKVRRRVSVIDKENNLFLVESSGRLFQTDLSMTCPMNLNYTPEGIEIKKLDETALTVEELRKLEREFADERVFIKPLLVEELQNGELRFVA